MIVSLLGPPGSGKGTQARRIAAEMGLRYLASGDLFRRAITSGGGEAQSVRHYVERGLLVPDNTVVAAVMSQLHEIESGAGVILDGFPRSRPQAEALDAALNERKRQLDHVLHLNVPLNVVKVRLAGRRLCSNCTAVYHVPGCPSEKEETCDDCGSELYQRVDDHPDTITRRLDAYTQTTLPLIIYYRNRGVLREIDGDRAIEQVTPVLLDAMDVVLSNGSSSG